MYRGKSRDENYLFKELMPFGGQLEGGNRWLKIKALIPWGELEEEYAGYFSERGRPGLDARLVVGLFLLKHMSGLSDRELIMQLQENVYWQSFCWLEGFVSSKKLNSSSLTKIRKRLGPKFTKELEKKTYTVLIEKKIIRRKGMLVDATVMPEKIKYPNDVGLLNDVREWLVGWLREIGRTTGEKIRTYRRTARKMYLSFSKKKRKTHKEIERARKQMLQFVRRNLGQLKDRLNELDYFVRAEVEERLKVALLIYVQQRRMYVEKVRKIEDRIVSFWRPYVRPIKRGKGGRKDVEFGPKVSLSHVDGLTFVNVFDHDNYSEAKTEILQEQIDHYEEMFQDKPPSVTGDNAYGTRANRAMLQEKGIRAAFKPLGRPGPEHEKQKQYVRRKSRERNRIEGDIGNVKEHYGGKAIRYHYVEGSEMWVRLSCLAKNLKMVMARI
jgi:IS5 family transposase